MEGFKCFLARAYKTCTEKYLQGEIDFLIDIFTENAYNRNPLTNISVEYLQNINKPKINNHNNTKNNKNIVKLPLGPTLDRKLWQKFKKKEIKPVVTSGTNLKSILCQNYSKLPPNSYVVVYALNCSCNADYKDKAEKRVMTRRIEHQQYSIKGKLKSRWDRKLIIMPRSTQLATSKDIIKRRKI